MITGEQGEKGLGPAPHDRWRAGGMTPSAGHCRGGSRNAGGGVHKVGSAEEGAPLPTAGFHTLSSHWPSRDPGVGVGRLLSSPLYMGKFSSVQSLSRV